MMNNSTLDSPRNSCDQSQVEGPTARIYYQFLFPVILVLCWVGNTANLILYWHKFLRESPTVRLLMAKAVSNLLYISCMIPNFVYFFSLIGDSPSAHHHISAFYWHSLKYVLFASNLFNIISIWLTVAVTAEHYVLVSCPVRGRQWSTIRHAHLTILLIFPLAVLLQFWFLLTRITRAKVCPYNPNYIIYRFSHRSAQMAKYEQIYYFLHSSLVLFLPMLLLITFSIGIYSKLLHKRQFRTNTEQKRCVTRLALATTVCHLVFEMPHVIVNICAVTFGTDRVPRPLSESANFLSIFNSSIPFVVYLTCSKRFRQLCSFQFCGYCCCCSIPEEDLELFRGTGRHADKKQLNFNELSSRHCVHENRRFTGVTNVQKTPPNGTPPDIPLLHRFSRGDIQEEE